MPSIVVEVSDEIADHWTGLAERASVPLDTWLGLCGLWGAVLDLPMSRIVLRQPPVARSLIGVAWEVGEYPHLTSPMPYPKGGAHMINKAILVGNVGREPVVRSTAAGLPVASFSLATTRKWRDKEGNAQEQTEWHTIVCFGRLAEVARDYLRRGRQVYVEGRIKTRSWEDRQSGETKYRTEIVCESFQMLGGRGEIGEGPSSAQGAGGSEEGPGGTGRPLEGDDVGDRLPAS